MKQLSRAWKALIQEPDVTAVAILILVLGIGSGLNLHAGPDMAFSLTCDDPMMDAHALTLDLPFGSAELAPAEFPDIGFPLELEMELGDLDTGVGPI